MKTILITILLLCSYALQAQKNVAKEVRPVNADFHHVDANDLVH